MSVWTSIGGMVRFDGFTTLGKSKRKQNRLIKDLFGYTCTFHSDAKEWDACNVPCGTEGSLQYTWIEEKDESYVGAGVLLIEGNLRSYEDIDEIYAWIQGFTAKAAENNLMPRNMAISVNCGGTPYIITINDDEKAVLLKLPDLSKK